MLAPVQRILFTLLALPVLVLGFGAAASADTIYVCWDGSGDYLTIQEGIDAAQDADQVVVCDGTYTGPGNKNLDFGGKPITVRSANGPDNCIIDCETDGRGFYFHSGETGASVVGGFTIRNGYVENWGGGVYCAANTSPTITNCTITGNRVEGYSSSGGGVCCEYSSPTITDCTITNNAARAADDPFEGADGAGGGVYCDNSNPTITNCTISGNEAVGGAAWEDDGRGGDAFGGGIYCEGSNPTITNCTISGNWAEGGFGLFEDGNAYAGAVYCDSGNPTITNCTISGNWAYPYGGGIYCYYYSDPTITNSTISGNWANYGGAVYCYGGSPTISNSTMRGNLAAYGAAVYCRSSSPTITNCTISDNSAGYYGGAVCCDGGSPTITDCILWGDTPDEIYVYFGNPSVTYSDVEGSWPGTGNIDEDPLFVPGPFGNYYLSQTAAGQDEESHCVDAGSDTAENLGLNTRTTRTDQVPDSGIVDMGYHYPILCLGDLNDDGKTDQSDLGILLADWGCDDPVNGCAGDLNGDDKTDQADLGILLADWGCDINP